MGKQEKDIAIKCILVLPRISKIYTRRLTNSNTYEHCKFVIMEGK